MAPSFRSPRASPSTCEPPVSERPPISRALDWLLVASVAFVAVLAAAYVWIPDVARGLGVVADLVATRAGIQ